MGKRWLLFSLLLFTSSTCTNFKELHHNTATGTFIFSSLHLCHQSSSALEQKHVLQTVICIMAQKTYSPSSADPGTWHSTVP